MGAYLKIKILFATIHDHIFFAIKHGLSLWHTPSLYISCGHQQFSHLLWDQTSGFCYSCNSQWGRFPRVIHFQTQPAARVHPQLRLLQQSQSARFVPLAPCHGSPHLRIHSPFSRPSFSHPCHLFLCSWFEGRFDKGSQWLWDWLVHNNVQGLIPVSKHLIYATVVLALVCSSNSCYRGCHPGPIVASLAVLGHPKSPVGPIRYRSLISFHIAPLARVCKSRPVHIKTQSYLPELAFRSMDSSLHTGCS